MIEYRNKYLDDVPRIKASKSKVFINSNSSMTITRLAVSGSLWVAYCDTVTWSRTWSCACGSSGLRLQPRTARIRSTRCVERSLP